MRLLLLSLAALIGLSSPALATGGFACAIDDENLRFTFMLGGPEVAGTMGYQ